MQNNAQKEKEFLIEKNVLRLTPKLSMLQEYAGCQRAFIELHEKPQEARRDAERYFELVNSLADELRSRGIGSGQEEAFAKRAYGIVRSRIRVKTGSPKTLFESMRENSWDCDPVSFLLIDVAKRLGIKARLIVTPGHALVATENFFIQTADGKTYGIGLLKKNYPVVYLDSSDQSKMQSLSYFGLGRKVLMEGNYEKAAAYFSLGIAINPNDAGMYASRAAANAALGRYDEALADIRRSIEIYPNKKEIELEKMLLELKRIGGKVEFKSTDEKKR